MAKESSFCHVFLSFKGETRDTFICYLRDALEAKGFVAFMDKMNIHAGDEVDSSIKGSMSAIIVFSRNYASSTWCLDELLLILQRNKTSRYFIIPIFYDIEPSDLKKQSGSYAQALEGKKARHSDKVEKWRAALLEVANIYGERAHDGMRDKFIKETVKSFRDKFSRDKFSEKFSEFHNPMTAVQNKPSTSRHDKVILYFITERQKHGMDATELIKTTLRHADIFFEERNCTNQPKYIKELKKLVGKEAFKFPMVIVNGKNLNGEEEMEGINDLLDIHLYKLRGFLNMLHSLLARQLNEYYPPSSLYDRRVTRRDTDVADVIEFKLSTSKNTPILKIRRGDITRWYKNGTSDAIVNPTKKRMVSNGVFTVDAIRRAAGPELVAACKNIPQVLPGVRCPTGEARITSGFKLRVCRVIHTVGPVHKTDSNPASHLRNAYRNSLIVAKENNIKYVAFPAISCGTYGFPHGEAATLALSTVIQHGDGLKEEHFVLFEDDIYRVWLDKAYELLQTIRNALGAGGDPSNLSSMLKSTLRIH